MRWAVLSLLPAVLLAQDGAYVPEGFLAFPPQEEAGAVSAVAVDRQRDRVYVLHRGRKPLMAFDASGRFLQSWGEGLFKTPHGLRVDRDGNIWTTDNGNHTLRQFSPDGKLLLTLDRGFRSPDDIVFASTGEMIVADAGSGRLLKLAPDGRLLASWGRKGKGPGEFAAAHALAIDAEDRIYVADRGNHRVQIFSLDGSLLGQWKGFGNPFGLCVTGGQLIVSDGDAHRMTTFDLSGRILSQWGGPGTLRLPHLMDAGAGGRLYVAEVEGNRVQIFRPPVSLSEDTMHREDRIDAAHRVLFQTPTDKKKAASALTASVAQPAAAGAFPVRRRNYIDEHIFGRMAKDNVPHAALASDEEFARRAWLDATGRIPDYDELVRFLNDADPDKRDKLIDRLVDSEAFVDKWSYYFEDLFRAGARMGHGLNLFHFWIREWLSLDRPYNEIVTELLTGAGKTSFSVPGGLYFARDFVKAKDDPESIDAHDLVNIPDTIDEFTITYTKVFLGLNLACISCHDGKNHLEKVNVFLTGKTREQFFQQAAFFGKTRQIMNWENGYQANTEYTVDDLGTGYDTRAESIVRVPRSGGDPQPRFLLTGEGPRPGENERDELARLLTSHIQFARAFTNRIWAELMGFGIVEPVDDFDLARYDPANLPEGWSLQPSNPALLDALARDFQQNNFSFKGLVRRIMKSSAYQLSSRFEGDWKEEYAPYYARKFVRMLSAAELHDAVALATARPGQFASGSEKVPMVQQMSEPRKADNEVKNFLRIFGQSNRDDMPKKTPPSALQAMLLMQSRLVTDRVLAMSGSRVEQLLKEEADDRALLEKLFLSTLSRRPNEAEARVGLETLARDRRRGAENLQWALINSPEFLFNF